MAVLILDRVAKMYPGSIAALREVSLAVEQDERVVLLGPSGCGKTTTLRLVAGLEEATAGEIFFSERNARDLPPWKRGVEMLFQRPALLPHRTVRQILESGSAVSRPDLDALSETFGITGFGARRAEALSGGEKQRVALVRSLARRAPFLLLDEPLAHLDVPVKRKLWQELALLHRRFPATMLYVTHDPAEALALADRIAVLLDGMVQQIDSPRILQNQPAHRYVAEVLQDPEDPLNFLDFRLESLRSLPFDPPLREDRDCILAVPASQVELGRCESPGLAWAVRAVQPGRERQLTICEREQVRILARVGAEQGFQPGDRVMVKRMGSTGNCFDRTTGLRRGIA